MEFQMPNPDPLAIIGAQVQRLRTELDELETALPTWLAQQNLTGSKHLRPIAERVVLSAKHLQVLVREHTFSPGA